MMQRSTPLLDVRDLSVGLTNRHGAFLAAHRVGFAVAPGQSIGLLGESGCGKSITLRALLGLVPHPGEIVGGSVHWKGRDWRSLTRQEVRRIRGKEIAMIFQDPAACLNPVFTIGDQISETLRIKLAIKSKAARELAADLLSRVGIPAPRERLRLYPHELSGGMRQRVMISMAVGAEPDLLLADEPTTALDVTIQDQILTLLAGLKDKTSMSMILVSHDVGVVAQNCDVILVMYAGRIMESGPALEVLRAPRHPYTRGLLAAIPHLRVGAARHPLRTIAGQPPNPANLPEGCPFQQRCSFARPECRTIAVTLDRALPGHGSACPVVT
ncbi:ABC transporter ATP-binding protein [Nordella sp. HKS 07]|uniref:ABC transporter ATP-binding protein n=1 Tax=Nordella sp. HKS 07 TaxID=2712222 RepID=UPI0019D030E4|nr:ABC transporter ATP-binding protein [Nordella sp. HKS 07]